MAKAVKAVTKPVIMHAARQELVDGSGRIAGEVFDAMREDRNLARKLKKMMIAEPQTIRKKPIECLAHFLDKNMSKQDWIDHKAFYDKPGRGDKIDCYDVILDQKKKCYPNNIEVGDFEAKIPLKDLLEKTVERFFEDAENYMMLLKTKENFYKKYRGQKFNLKLSYKWGLDGTDGGNEYHQEGTEDKNNLQATQLVILQLEVVGTGQILWRNPMANSASSCR